VILPFLGMHVTVGHTAENQQQSYITRTHDESIELMRLKSKYYQFSEHLYGIYSQEYKKALASELNNIYVALTRARDEMYGFIPKRVGGTLNLATLLIPEELCEIGAIEKIQKLEGEKIKRENIIKLPASKHHDWIHYLRDEFMDYGEIINRDVRLKGEVIHFILSEIENLHGANLKVVRDKAFDKARFCFSDIPIGQDYLTLVDRVLDHHEFDQFFKVEDGEIFNEKEIVNQYGHTKRIDRMIVKEKELWIVDFKLSQLEGAEYHDQVREYMELARNLYPKHSVKGYLVYLENLEMEEVGKSQVKTQNV